MVLLRLCRKAVNKEFVPARAPLFELGEDGEYKYVVVQGEADIQIGDSAVETAGPGDILGKAQYGFRRAM